MVEQNVGTPTIWNFVANPAYAWLAKGAEPVYHQQLATGLSRSTGVDATLGGPSLGAFNDAVNDLYERVYFLKDGQDLLNARGYKGYSIVAGSATITPAQMGTLILNTDHSSADIEYTLPSRVLLAADGCEVTEQIGSSPGFQSLGGNHKTIIIIGATNTSGHPIKVTVDVPVSPGSPVSGDDLQQTISIENIGDQSIYLYADEYAELVPTIIWTGASTNFYVLNWAIYVHRSNYGKVAEYVQMPDGALGKTQVKSDGTAVSRAKYARLWQVLNKAIREDGSTSVYTVVSHATHTSNVGKYGVGDGSTTLDLTNLTSLNNAAFFQYNIYY